MPVSSVKACWRRWIRRIRCITKVAEHLYIQAGVDRSPRADASTAHTVTRPAVCHSAVQPSKSTRLARRAPCKKRVRNVRAVCFVFRRGRWRLPGWTGQRRMITEFIIIVCTRADIILGVFKAAPKPIGLRMEGTGQTSRHTISQSRPAKRFKGETFRWRNDKLCDRVYVVYLVGADSAATSLILSRTCYIWRRAGDNSRWNM